MSVTVHADPDPAPLVRVDDLAPIMPGHATIAAPRWLWNRIGRFVSPAGFDVNRAKEAGPMPLDEARSLAAKLKGAMRCSTPPPSWS